MLKTLKVKNFALIREAEIEFAPGLNLITGETGAGKSLLIGALGAVLGDKIPPDSLRTGADKCIIEGEFGLSPDSPLLGLLEDDSNPSNTLIIRREIHRSGRSRSFINDSPASFRKLAEIGAMLVDLCGQHEHQTLLKTENHLEYLDRYAGLMPERSEVAGFYSQYRAAIVKLSRLKRDQQQQAARRDRTAFEIREIEAVNPQPDEDEKLQNEEKTLQHGELILQFCLQTERDLSTKPESVLDTLSDLLKELDTIAAFSPELKSIQDDLRTAFASLEEAARAVISFRSKFNFSPDRLEDIRERLAELSRLKRKYGGSIEAVLAHLASLKSESQSFTSLEAEIDSADGNLDEIHRLLIGKSKELSRLRAEAAPRLKRDMESAMSGLGFNYADFDARLNKTAGDDAEIDGQSLQLQSTGIDNCEIFISTNPGEPPLPLKDIASGGEISRIMLALKAVIAGRDKPGTLIFDEIDIGISGKIARKVGLKLLDASSAQQVLVITHLPQIASLPARHFSAVKIEADGRAVSRFIQLDDVDRVGEVSKLLTTGKSKGKVEEYARELLSGQDI